MTNFQSDQNDVGIYIKDLRDPSNLRVRALFEEIANNNKRVQDLFENPDDFLKVTCSMVDDACKVIYSPIMLANINDIRDSFSASLRILTKKKSNPEGQKKLLYTEGFNFYFASHLVVYLERLGKESINTTEASKIITLSQNIEWSSTILSKLLQALLPGNLSQEILNHIFNYKIHYFTTKSVIFNFFEKIGSDKLDKKQLNLLHSKIDSIGWNPYLLWKFLDSAGCGEINEELAKKILANIDGIDINSSILEIFLKKIGKNGSRQTIIKGIIKNHPKLIIKDSNTETIELLLNYTNNGSLERIVSRRILEILIKIGNFGENIFDLFMKKLNKAQLKENDTIKILECFGKVLGLNPLENKPKLS